MSNQYNVRSYNDDSDIDGESRENEIHIPTTNIATEDIYGLMVRRANTSTFESPPSLSHLRRNELYREYVNTTRRQSESNKQAKTNLDNNTFVDTDKLVSPIDLTKHPRPDTETYELEKFNKNAMIIFNHENFWTDLPRRGTALDVAALEDTFKQFRFEVETHNDLTRNRLFEVLNEFSSRDYKEYGCICVAILTHGLDDGYLKATDARYRERDAFACFDCHVNPSLVAKPIIFLIQACRGPYAAYAVSQGADVELDSSSRETRPPESDLIIFHSSFFGRASVRVVSEGTWFIQTVCEQIKRYASSEHLEKLFRRVRRIVALEKEYQKIKQMPVVTTTLLKKLYLKKILVTHYDESDACNNDNIVRDIRFNDDNIVRNIRLNDDNIVRDIRLNDDNIVRDIRLNDDNIVRDIKLNDDNIVRNIRLNDDNIVRDIKFNESDAYTYGKIFKNIYRTLEP